ncbi:CHAT domain-containing protein [Singulisphaera sp. Ch08]|uniref:CHAT domain-containing protein n=1 Tax=Singulisphaera sp. Ch08 TaxID=3120278 RepID=A0AAU7CMQ9_9BACT
MPDRPMTYRNMDLEMTDLGADGAFRVRVVGQSPGGEMRADEAERPVFRAGDFEVLKKLERRRITRDELITVGERLAGLLLSGRVRALFDAGLQALKANEGLRLRLRIEPLPLAALPWEFAFVPRTGGEKVPQDFLALRREISISRYETIGPPLKSLGPKEKFRIVLALASPTDEQELELEKDELAITAAVAQLNEKASGGLDLDILEHATRARLLATVKGCDIFHFAGHGIFEGADLAEDGRVRRRGKIVLEKEDGTGERVGSEVLANELGNAGVRLVVLGACQSAARDEGGAWTGVASALVREQIPAVVAMQYKVLDTNASLLAAHLYRRVLAGATIDEAVFEGRQAIFNLASPEERDWGVPVLYLRAEDGVLFPPPGEDAQAGRTQSVLARAVINVKEVEGKLTGIKAKRLRGNAEATMNLGTVKSGGEATGMEFDEIG